MHRHGYQGRKLGRERDQRIALIRSLSVALIEHGSIETTLPKAKELRPDFEKLVSKAKKADLHNRRILVNQYSALAGSTTVAAAQPLTHSGDSEETAELMTPIEDLNLTARTANALYNNGIKTIGDLVTLGEIELRELKGFGSKALDEVKDKMAELEF